MQRFSLNGGFLDVWKSSGTADGWFYRPYKTAVGPSGNIYVVDSYNHRVQKFQPNGAFILKWGNIGIGDGQFFVPSDVAADSAGNIYVVNRFFERVQKFSSTGTFIATWGSAGANNSEFDDPYGIAVDPNNNVYVADTYNHRIQKFSSSGNYITQWGSLGSGPGQFYRPHDVAADIFGNIYVVDQSNFVQKFTSSGAFLLRWGSRGNNDGEFRFPYGVTADIMGDVYVTDRLNDNVQKFKPDGTFVMKFGQGGGRDGEFNQPYGVAVDIMGNVYVADTYNNRIQKFKQTLVIDAANRPNLYVIDIFSDQIDLAWNDLAYETSYVLLRSTEPDIGTAVVIATLPANQTSYNDSTISTAPEYYYWLLPYNGANALPPSEVLKCVIVSLPSVPAVFPTYFNPEIHGIAKIFFGGVLFSGEVRIYDVSGDLIKNFTYIQSKIYVKWDGKDMHGNELNTGIYIIFIKGKNTDSNRDINTKIKMMLVK